MSIDTSAAVVHTDTPAATLSSTDHRPHARRDPARGPMTFKAITRGEMSLLASLAPPKPVRTPTTHRPESVGLISLTERQDRARRYLATIPGAVSGDRGHDRTYYVACKLVLGYDLAVEDAYPLLAEWNATCKPAWSERELMHKLADADKDKTTSRGYLLRSETPVKKRHKAPPVKADGEPKPDAELEAELGRMADELDAEEAAEGGATGGDEEVRTGAEIILAYYRELYKPDFRKGNAIHCSDGGIVMMNEATATCDSKLIMALADAINAPCYKGGAVNENALPGFYRTWSRVAWGDLIRSLPDEATATFAGPGSPACEEFTRLLTEVLMQEVVLGENIKDGEMTRTERRSLIDWCQRFAKTGPWRDIRGKRIWCKYVPVADGGVIQLKIALRVELFAQMRADRRLTELNQNKFAGLVAKYGIGSARTDDRPHGRRAVVLSDDLVNRLVAGLTNEDVPDMGEPVEDTDELDAR